MTDPDAYFAYLTRRSRLGMIYRRYWLYPRLVDQLEGRVLDIGCGIGDFLAFRPGTIGVDINPRLVDWCRQRGLDAHAMPVDQLPVEDASFDGAVLDNVLEHIADPMPLLAEAKRVLRPGGTLLIGVPGRRGYAADPDHKVFYDADSLIETLGAAGFARGRLFAMPLPWGWLDRMIPQYCLYGTFVVAGPNGRG